MPYRIRPRGWYEWLDDDQPVLDRTITVEPAGARNTGLVTKSGDAIWSEPDPIGYRFSEQPKDR